MKPHIPATFVKVRRGGECFWAEILNQDASGYVARCDSHTIDPTVPHHGDVFHIANTEDIFGAVSSLPRLRVVK